MIKKENIRKFGIIAEYNPLHSGHLYQISETKKMMANDDLLFIAMSGNVVQRGEFSIVDKYNRANIAKKNGADVIVEIPPKMALNNANIFANYGIQILSKLEITDLVFGSESNNLGKLKEVATMMLEKSFWNEIDRLIKIHQSLPRAFEAISGNKFKSNDILGICYIYEILKNKLNIKIHAIKRSGNHKSASQLRELIINGEDVKDWTSIEVGNYEEMNRHFSEIRKFIILNNDSSPIIKYISNKLTEIDTNSWYQFISLASNKSYTKSRIRREMISFYLNSLNKMSNKTQILAISNDGRCYLMNKNNEYIYCKLVNYNN